MGHSVGLLGGTFDPVHNGHVEIAQSFLASDYISELWIILTPHPPQKKHQDFSPFNVRLNMLKAAFLNMDKVKISTIERELEAPQYSYKTVQVLKHQHPQKIFYLCMGEDSYTSFHRWKAYKNILENVNLLVAVRPGYDKNNQCKEEIRAKAYFVNHQPIGISSTSIRTAVQEGNYSALEKWVPKPVNEIIQRENLYKSGA